MGKGGIIVFLVIFGLIAVFGLSKRNQKSEPQFTVNLTPTNNLGFAGSAVIKNVSNSATVLLSVNQDSENTVRPAFIRAGSCLKPGEVKFKLTAPDARESETDLPVSIGNFGKMLPLILTINRSPNSSEVISCGIIH